MPNKSVTVLNGDGSTRTITIPDRSRYAGRRTINSGYVYPPSIAIPNNNNAYYTFTSLSDTSFRVNSDLVNDGANTWRELPIIPTHVVRTGKHLVEFDLTLHSGSIANDGYRLMARDGTNTNTNIKLLSEGHNSIEIVVEDDGISQAEGDFDPSIFFSARPDSQFDLTISNLKVTHEPREVTVDRTARVHTSDRKGESRPLLSKVVGGAAAAYSLRDLNDRTGNNNVVRVRRESDNSEKDFKAKEVSNGTMARWVNEQPTLPLDLRELDTDTGERDGALIEAAAAYSLRDLTENRSDVRTTSSFVLSGATGSFATYNGTLFIRGEQAGALAFLDENDNDIFFRYNAAASAWKFQDLNVQAGSLATATDDQTYPWESNWTGSDFASAVFTREAAGKYTVEVRRNVDGATKSFTADEVTDGTLESFVNASFDDELPLDQATGAAAAYSLRNLKASGTDVTTSGDTAGDTTGKYVVQVRRSSDDAVQSFTASEVADGTLEDWVNTDVTIYQSDFSSSIDGWSVGAAAAVGNQDGVSDGTTSKDNVLKLTKAQDSQAYIQRDQGVIAGLTYTVSGSFYAPSSNTGVDGILIKDGIAGGSLSNYPSGYLTSNGVWTDFSFSYTATVSGNQRINMGISSLGSNPNGSSAGSAGDVLYIADLQFVETTSNGHVRTWYDQSGSDNHAVQTTAANQPKIVDGGTLIKRNNNPAVESTSDDSLSFTLDALSADGQQSVFAVLENDVTAQDGFGDVFRVTSDTGTVTNRRPQWFIHPTDGALYFSVDSTSGYNNTDRDKRLYSHVMNDAAGGTSTIHRDGTQVDSRSITLDANATFQSGQVLGVGTNATGALYMSEVIYYTSDQSDKRRAIEENIANHYDISLAAFSRDGTVSTWYDQSGNTNDATQTDPTKQPKIVDGGNLLKDSNNNPEVDFDGAGDTFVIDFGADLTQANSIFMVHQSDTTDSSLNEFLDSVNQSAPRTRLDKSGANYRMLAGTNVDTGVALTTDKSLIFALYNGASSFFAKDGVTSSTFDVGSAAINQNSNLGSSGANTYDGTMQEFIIYNSDQSDNRTAIEANIGETYGITAIPAANDTVNGYVQTWYDQSGNVPANDAVQNAAANQPKIVGEVTSGQPHAFLGAIEFDGVDDVLNANSLASSFSGEDLPISAFSVSESNTTGQIGIIWRFYKSNFNNPIKGIQYRSTAKNGFIYRADDLTNANRLQFDNYLANEVYQHTVIVPSTTANIWRNSTNVLNDIAADINQVTLDAFEIAEGMNGSIRELIIYDSDQSSNRTAIEANINNQYDIY